MNQRLRSPGSRALAGTLIGSAPGFFLPFVIAAHLGVGRATDAFAFAFAVTLFVLALVTVVAEANLLPQADGYRRAGGPALQAYIAKTLRRVAVVAGGTYAAVALIAATILAAQPAFARGERVAVLACLIASSPLVITSALNSCQAVALYVSGDFLMPTASQAARAILPLGVISFLGRGYAAVEVVTILLAAGEIVRFWILRRRVTRVVQHLPSGSDTVSQLSYGSVARASLPHALNMLILAVNPLVDRFVAASLAAGAVTVLDLGEKVFFAPQMLITSSLILVAGTQWSNGELTAAHIAASYRRSVTRIMVLATIVAISTAAALLIIGQIGRSTLVPGHLASAIPVALCLLVGLPFESASILSARLMTATQQTRALPTFAAAALLANIVGDLIGARLFGIIGIAAATVVVRIATAALFVPHCRRLTMPRRSNPLSSLSPLPRLEDANAL